MAAIGVLLVSISCIASTACVCSAASPVAKKLPETKKTETTAKAASDSEEKSYSFSTIDSFDLYYRRPLSHVTNEYLALGNDEQALSATENKMKNSLMRRPGQVEAVLQSMAESPVHSLAVGDFNDTPVSYTYQRLKTGRKDSFIEAGKGFGATYIKFRPFLRIDYILYPKELEACTYQVPKVRLSDHYPILFTTLVSYQEEVGSQTSDNGLEGYENGEKVDIW